MAKQFVVSDGKLMLVLEPAEEGGYNVSSPLDPQLFTQAETLEEAFANAYDARKALNEARAKLAKKFPPARDKASKPKKGPSVTEAQDPQDTSAASSEGASSRPDRKPRRAPRRVLG